MSVQSVGLKSSSCEDVYSDSQCLDVFRRAIVDRVKTSLGTRLLPSHGWLIFPLLIDFPTF